MEGTLCTTYTDENEFAHRDLTPLEMARELGYKHLFELLTPVIRHSIPNHILTALEAIFHKIICDDISEEQEEPVLRLPELGVLTELDIPMMDFWLSPPGASDFKVSTVHVR
jgi:hypothetical protein